LRVAHERLHLVLAEVAAARAREPAAEALRTDDADARAVDVECATVALELHGERARLLHRPQAREVTGQEQHVRVLDELLEPGAERAAHGRVEVHVRDGGDRDHGTVTPSSSRSVKNAAAYGDSLVRSRTRSKSICSRSARLTSRTLSESRWCS